MGAPPHQLRQGVICYFGYHLQIYFKDGPCISNLESPLKVREGGGAVFLCFLFYFVAVLREKNF